MGTYNSKEGIPDGSPIAQGVSFEVILSPKVENAKIPQLTPKRAGARTRQAINEKLEAADKRRKEREDEIRKKLAGEDDHVKEVRQAMSEYEERRKRETQARYQRRLFIFAENQEHMANERADQWYEKARKIEAAKKTVVHKEKSFRESMKEKLCQKMEKFKENHSKYQVHRRESALLKAGRFEAVRSSKQKQNEEHVTATAEKIKQKYETLKENREKTINMKVEKIQEKQSKVEEAKVNMEKSLEMTSSIKLMELEVRLDKMALKRQLHEKEIQVKAKAHFEKTREMKRLREEKERRFSDCTEENLQIKFEKAERIREQNAATRQQAFEKKIEREQRAKDNSETEKLREKIEEKHQRLEVNRTAILNAKVEQCQKESTKVKITKENREELVRNQGKATDIKLQARLNTYKDNRQRRLSERMVKGRPLQSKNGRESLLEITNGGSMVDSKLNVTSPRKETTSEKIHKISPKDSTKENAENENNCEKARGLAENFRNRNLEFLGLRSIFD